MFWWLDFTSALVDFTIKTYHKPFKSSKRWGSASRNEETPNLKSFSPHRTLSEVGNDKKKPVYTWEREMKWDLVGWNVEFHKLPHDIQIDQLHKTRYAITERTWTYPPRLRSNSTKLSSSDGSVDSEPLSLVVVKERRIWESSTALPPDPEDEVLPRKRRGQLALLLCVANPTIQA